MNRSGLFRLLFFIFTISLFCVPASAAESLTDADRVTLIEQRYNKGEISQDIYLMLKNKYAHDKKGSDEKGVVIYGFDLQEKPTIGSFEGEPANIKQIVIDEKEKYIGKGSLKCVADYPSKWSGFSLSDFKNTPDIDDMNMHPSIWMKAGPKFDVKVLYVIEDREGEWFEGVLIKKNRNRPGWFRYIAKEPISEAKWCGMKEGTDTSNINATIDYPVKFKKLIIYSRVPVEDVTFYLDDLCVLHTEYYTESKKGEYFHFHNIWNLVPNAGFEHTDSDGVKETIANWHSRDNCWSLDDSNIHGGKTALKVNNTCGYSLIDSKNLSNINYVDTYEFTGWARTEKVRSLQLGMKWYRFDPFRGASSTAYKELGISWSKPIKGSSDWQQISVTAFPPRGARWVSFCIKADTDEGTAWIDDLEFDGFGADPVQIIESQAGYAPWSKKEIIVRTKKPSPGGSFGLIDAKTGKKVLSGELKSFGKYTWARYNFIVDISSFRKEGEYMLEAEVKDIGKALSHKFRIKRGLYSHLAQKGLEYCYIQRCGMAIPGWHGACHLDDAVGKDENGNEIHVDLTGGWHDAADYSKQRDGDRDMVWSLSVLQEQLAPDWHKLENNLPDPLAEAWWGTDFLLKRHLGNGRYILGTIGHPSPLCYIFIPPEDRSDNIPGTGDEREFIQMKKGDVPQYLHVLAKYAQEVKPFDKEKYERCMAMVNDLYEKHHQKYADSPFHHGTGAEYVMLQIFLYQIDPKNGTLYRKRARKGIENLLRRIRSNDKAFLRNTIFKEPGRTFFFWHYGCAIYNFVEAFKRYSEEFPDDDLIPALKEEVRWFMETVVVPLASRSPYGHMMYLNLNRPIDIYANRKPDGNNVVWEWTCGYNQYLAKISRVCSLAAELLNEPTYLDIAERQIQWIMGRNPRRLCMMGGVGYREMYCSTMIKSNQKIYHDASIPGGVVIGLGAGCPRPRRGTVSWNVNPEGFPCYGGEVWQNSTAFTILACQELEYAKKHYFPDN